MLLLLIRIAGSAVFEGCFLDDSQDRDLDSYHLTLNDNSPWKCIEQCKQLGTLYAGVQNGRDCYCGLDYGKHGKLHDTRCKIPCSGDRELWCGGELANHIFRTGLITLDNVGCYEHVDAEISFPASNDLTQFDCVTSCWRNGYAFSVMQSGSMCSCANRKDEQEKVPKSRCNHQCTGDTTSKCGGKNVKSVFATGIEILGDNYLGCFKDNKTRRDLGHQHFIENCSPDMCQEYCLNNSYKYAGIQDHCKCFCGSFYGSYGAVSPIICNAPCPGDAHRKCGGHLSNSIYKTGDVKYEGMDKYIGCYRDNVLYRDLNTMTENRAGNSPSVCIRYCQAFGTLYAGMQSGKYCFCGNSYGRYGKLPDSKCIYTCTGDRGLRCGGDKANSIYHTGAQESGYVGCFYDRRRYRDVDDFVVQRSDLTPDVCLELCWKKGFQYAALQSKKWCRCGDAIGQYGKAKESTCNAKCSGDNTKLCGGYYKNSIYRTGLSPTDPKYVGCYALRRQFYSHRQQYVDNSPEKCTKFCYRKKYFYAGLRGQTCFCGTKNSNYPHYYPKLKEEDCPNACPGNKRKKCGSSRHISLYTTFDADKQYLGCFRDRRQRDLHVLAYVDEEYNSPAKCIHTCKLKRYLYAAVQYSRECYCGSSYGKHGAVEESICNLTCRGYPSKKCGGVWTNGVYSTGLPEYWFPCPKLDEKSNCSSFATTTYVFSGLSSCKGLNVCLNDLGLSTSMSSTETSSSYQTFSTTIATKTGSTSYMSTSQPAVSQTTTTMDPRHTYVSTDVTASSTFVTAEGSKMTSTSALIDPTTKGTPTFICPVLNIPEGCKPTYYDLIVVSTLVYKRCRFFVCKRRQST